MNSDMTLCVNDFCPMRKNCLRARKGNGSENQSYSYFNEKNEEECEYQIPIYDAEKWEVLRKKNYD